MNKWLTNSKTLIILDAGHGIDTPGKRSPLWKDNTQLFEYSFNRTIVSMIIGYLKIAGISYIELVTEVNDISLQERCARVNELYRQLKDKYNIYLVSIHGNASEKEKASGIEVWTTKGETASDLIATKFFKKLKDLGWKVREDTLDGDADKEENFHILKYTNCPAILTENGFYTNEEECKKMLSFYWQKQIALCHYRAIQDIEYEK